MSKYFGLLNLLLLIVGLAVAQDVRKPVVRFSHPILDEVNSMVESKQYAEAINLSLKTAERFRSQSNWEGYIAMMLRAAEIETFEVWKARGFPDVKIYPDYKRPHQYLQDLDKYAGKIIDEYPYLKADVLFTKAVVYEWLDMPNTSELSHNVALNLRKTIYGEQSREVADSYLWRGVLYSHGLQREDLAERDLRIAQELEKRFLPDSRYALGSVYYWLADIATKNFRFDEALTLAHQYISLYHDLPYEHAFGIQLIANVYWHQNEFEKSLESRRQAIKIYQQSDFEEDLIDEYSNLASVLANLERFDEAEQMLKESERILNNSGDRDPYRTQFVQENFGGLYTRMKRYDDAERYFNSALHIALRQYGKQNDEVVDIYRERGSLYLQQNFFERALNDFQKALSILIPEFHPDDYRNIPNVQYEHPYFKNLIATTFRKGDAFLAWFICDGNSDHLNLALDNYRNAYHQILAARQSIGDDLSKPFLMSNFLESVENSLACAKISYDQTGNQRFIHDIFYFIELTKYLNVLDALQRADRSGNSEVPVDLLVQLKNIKQDLDELQRFELQGEHLGLSADSLAIMRDKILNLIEQRRDLMSKVMQASGHTVSHKENILSMKEVQKQLKSDEQIIEFFWGTDSIYSISITRETADITATSQDGGFDSLFLSVRNVLENQRSFNQAEKYGVAASIIYQKLFQPIITKRKIIVIPDETLNFIPIEALVSHTQTDAPTFKDLHYLIYDHEITYAYSSSILFHKNTNKQPTIKRVLAFSYSGGSDTLGTDRENDLAPLSGTHEEARTVSRIFDNVMLFSGPDALKDNFTSHTSDHDLIHLGIHGIGDTEVADNSRLIFRSDSIESGDLYAYEIYNLKIDAKLVVLSGCETGLGKGQSGEGIFSIARAFSYAGCPSVVMSLWRAPDVFTGTIMKEFYEQVHQGKSIRSSLRTSKLKYLKGADELTAHPSNWAGLALNGKDQTFEKSTTPMTGWLILAGIGIAGAYLTMKRKKIKV